MDDLPEWVPVYPDAEATGTYAATTPGGSGGSFQLTTADGVEEVLAFYVEELEGAGWSVQKTEFSGPDGKGAQGMGSHEGHTVVVILSSGDEGTQAMVNYSES